MDIFQLSNEALAYLVANSPGFKVPFKATHQDYIDLANEVAAEREIEKIKAEAGESGHLPFEGADDCDDTCQGWSPDQGRCSCGNRRVGFTTGYGHSFQKPFVYAEAY